MIAKPYAHFHEGASTGSWEALALQLYFPDYFGRAWFFNPDLIDFKRYQLINIYEDDNASYLPINKWRQAERTMRRITEGQVTDTVKSISHFESMPGTKGGSGYQFNEWEAFFRQAKKKEGYPSPVWDKKQVRLIREWLNK